MGGKWGKALEAEGPTWVKLLVSEGELVYGEWATHGGRKRVRICSGNKAGDGGWGQVEKWIVSYNHYHLFTGFIRRNLKSLRRSILKSNSQLKKITFLLLALGHGECRGAPQRSLGAKGS